MKKVISLLLVILLFACMMPVNAFAAGGISISTSSITVEKGQNASFTIYASNAAGRVDIESSNPGVAAAASSKEFLDYELAPSKSVVINTGSVGTSVITVKCSDVTDFDDNPVGGTYTITVNVVEPATQATTKPKETTTASSNANLKSMSVEGYSLSPSFNQWTTEYTIIVPKDTKSINLSATPLNANCSVSGTGVLNISKLPQTFSIVCKAPNGETKTYHLTVKAPTEIGLTKLEVYALAALDPAFDPAVFEYTATVPFGTKSVDVKALFDDEQFKDAKIDVKGADNLEKSKDTVTVTVIAADGTETVYTIHIKYADEIVDQVTETVVKNRIPLWVVIVFLLLVVAFSIVFFFLGRRYERSQYEAYKKYYGNDDDDDIGTNDDNNSDGPSIFGGFDQSAD